MRDSVGWRRRPALVASLTLLLFVPGISTAQAQGVPNTGPTLSPSAIPKYVNQLVIPPVYEPSVTRHPLTGQVHNYLIGMTQFQQQILPPGFPKTTVWGYTGYIKDPKTGRPVLFRNAPGATFEAVRGIPVRVKWVNGISTPHLFPVDPTLHWANPNGLPEEPPKPWPPFPPGFPLAQYPVPLVTHLHGGEVPSWADGHPDAWFTWNGVHGPAYTARPFLYPNTQLPTTLWYHDHALGLTRINVYSGLAGFYLLRDPKDPIARLLPSGKYEVPIVIQDRSFNADGSFFLPTAGVNPDVHPYWNPEFFGNTIMVNGAVWPNLDVERRQYRFRLLNGSNARFYNLRFSNGLSFEQIGSDGGYLPHPVTLSSLLLAPGERADVRVDFSGVRAGTKVILTNDAKAPFPDGEVPDPQTVGQIMQFTVRWSCPVKPRPLPTLLNAMPRLTPNAPTRIMTLQEVMGPDGPVMVLLNGLRWHAPVTETPKVGSTEEWQLLNLTGDTHPIHLHLVQFQVLNRQGFDAASYEADWMAANMAPPLHHPPTQLPVEPYLNGDPLPPAPEETGWKDTVKANPREVTRILVRFAPQDADEKLLAPGVNLYSFDPTAAPGYVWHCHIIDHEDNEMMRPYTVVK